MTGKTHQIAGLSAGVSYFLLLQPVAYSPATMAAVAVGSSLAALLPDIDQPTAELWDKIPLLGHTLGKITSKVTLGHRNLTHSILGATICAIIVHFIVFSFPDYWGIDKVMLFNSFMIAYGSHLLLDSVTVEGIPLLFPIQKNFGIPPKPLDGIRIMSGKWFENLIIFPALSITLAVIIISNQDKLHRVLFH